jgi:hypothetical protein
MSAYWLLLILALGGLFTWYIYKLITDRTSWPHWMKVILSAFYGLSISGFLVLVLVLVLSSTLPQTFTLADRWQKCDPAYPDVCIPPGPPDLDCADLPYAHFNVLWPDPHHLDADGNGIGCEH